MKLPEKKIRELVKITGRSYSSNSLYGICPYCGQNEFGISLERNHVFNCFRKKSCGETGNIYKLIEHLGKDKHFIKSEKSLEIERLNIPENQKQKEIKLKKYKLPVGYRRTFNNKYLNKRGFTESDYERYEVGVSKIMLRNYVIFPVKHKDKYIGHVARSIHSKEYCENNDIKRYNNSKNNLGSVLYGRVAEITIIVEGIFDLIAMNKKFCDSYKNIGCVCTFGAKISNNQISLLKEGGCKAVYIAIDADVPKIIERLCNEIGQFFPTKVMKLSEGKDPDESSKEEIKKSFNSSENYINFTTLKRL